MITVQFWHLIWTGILTWMWASMMLRIQRALRKPFPSDLRCDSGYPSLMGGPLHIWLCHILPVAHLGKKPPTPAHIPFSEWFQKKREGKMSTTEIGPGRHQACMNVNHCRKHWFKKKKTHIKQNPAPGQHQSRTECTSGEDGHFSSLSASTRRTCSGSSSQGSAESPMEEAQTPSPVGLLHFQGTWTACLWHCFRFRCCMVCSN